VVITCLNVHILYFISCD